MCTCNARAMNAIRLRHLRESDKEEEFENEDCRILEIGTPSLPACSSTHNLASVEEGTESQSDSDDDSEHLHMDPTIIVEVEDSTNDATPGLETESIIGQGPSSVSQCEEETDSRHNRSGSATAYRYSKFLKFVACDSTVHNYVLYVNT